MNRLQMVAVLRKCLFSIEQIKTMLEHPELTPDIFTEYRNSLLSQRDLLDALAKKAETVEPEELENPEMLARLLSHEAKPLPLPKMDIKPRFRYLDELEEEPPHVQMQTNFAEDGDCSEALWLRYAGRSPSSGKFCLKHIFDMNHEPVETVVPDYVDRDSWIMRALKRLFELGMALGIFQILREWLAVPVPKKGSILPWAILALAFGGLRLVLALITWHKERSIWGMQS